jgi:cytochrome P450
MLVRAIWCEVLLGIGPDTPEFAETNALLRDLDPDLHLYGRAMPDRDVEVALDHLGELVRRACATRDRSLVGATWAERLEGQAPGALTDLSRVRNLIYTAVTSYDDVTGLLAWELWHLADQPKWVQQLRADPAGASALADRIVSETLRLAQSEFVIREARTDLRVGDAVVPRGWLVRACLRESHRDPAKFAQAETFDPDRFLGDRVGRDRYSPFGVDHRFCLGEQLTRTAGRVFALALADREDVVTRRDGPPELGVKRHWAPSSRWLLVMRAHVHPSTGMDAVEHLDRDT